MNKTEVTEIKKIFKKDDNGITRICGCYVDGEKNKRVELKEAFILFPKKKCLNMWIFFEKRCPVRLAKIL